jgi:8-oxo-dGTP diphosphatase
MKSERRVGAGVALLIVNGSGQILIKKRRGSHGDGTWGLVGGWMEHGESFLDTAQREGTEEAGLTVTGYTIPHVINSYFPQEDVHSVTVMLLIQPHDWSGTPKTMEPDKMYGDWVWADPGALPEPLFQPLKEGIEAYRRYL